MTRKTVQTILQMTAMILGIIFMVFELITKKEFNWMPLIFLLLVGEIFDTKVTIKECKCDKKVVKENNNN